MKCDRITIRTNYHEIPLLFWDDLTEAERSDFDWVPEEEEDEYKFFRYKGVVYCLQEFLDISESFPQEFQGWDGYQCDTFFSGILVRLLEDAEYVKAATFMC